MRLSVSLQPLRALAVLSVVGLLSFLAGCSSIPSGGQSKEAALAQMRSVDGVEDAVVSAGGSYSGFTRQSYTLVTVRLSPGFGVARMPGLATFLARLAWSVNVEEPNTNVVVGIDETPNAVLKSAFRDAGWDIPPDPGASLVYIPPELVRAKLGRWPGPVPKVPEGMIVEETDAGA